MKSNLLLFLIVLPFGVLAQQPEVFSTAEGAINGYDAVAYFKELKPIKGKPELVVEYLQAHWYFCSIENKNLFEENPTKYIPQFGGYCAFGMSKGYKAPTSPDAWTIIDDKLYLNYNTSVQKDWLKATDENIQKAESHWMTVKYK